MSKRQVQFKAVSKIEPCPKCGNKVDFTIHSEQFAEEYCEVWAVCKCGHTHDSGDRLEDVWGGCDDENVRAAMSCWNDAMAAIKETAITASAK